ncbi:E3 ubiquitin-protein ligase mgrn1 [Saguinus oedipus]|uniref:E3 ubiquitin-protein ligase mgrn1 n=1 Tax=Saguinus oedipus TaxID=9490 RepID=A0ABQ9UK61_SAGOE|nr:E3 ubiquitin-protein ligase mgrn1 [Saguinus oedipus]
MAEAGRASDRVDRRSSGRGSGEQVVPGHEPPSPTLSLQSSDSVPPGYEPISLLEALNGLRAVSPAIPSAPLYEEITYSGVSDGLSQASCPLAAIDHILDSSRQKGRPQSKVPDSTLRSPSSPIHEEDEEKLSEDVDAPPPLGGAELALRESSSPESFLTEEVEESSPKQGTRAPSIENVLQDSSPEHCGRGPPADIYLPDWEGSGGSDWYLHACHKAICSSGTERNRGTQWLQM